MVRRRRLGAIYLGDGRCLFRVWAPQAGSVAVHLLDPAARLLPLRREGEYFQGLFTDIPPGSRYVYRLDDGRERPDPASRGQPEGVHGPSQVVDLTFPWTDQQWLGRPLREYVIYELHVGTFTPEGTFAAIIPHLPRLRELGITALELMPVAPFPGARNWGYDGVYPFAVHQAYGGAAGLQHLVNACHGHGLAVILDVVYNHLGPEGNYFWEYGPYFTDQYQTPWGQAINYDQAYADQVREFFISNALTWLADFHIDALRLDALHAIIDLSPQPFLAELAAAVARLGECLGRRLYLLAESDQNDVKLLRPPALGGYGLDGHWLEDLHHALHAVLTGEQGGYYQDFGTLAHLAAAYQQGFVYTGQYSPYRRRRHGSPAAAIAPYRFIAFSQNHDQVGNRPCGERLIHLTSLAAAKLAAAAVILSPFTPLLFMGEEYGETAPFLYFISHSDPDLIAAVRRGRGEAMAACGCVQEAPDPQDPATLARSRLNLALADQEPHRTLWRFYRELLQLRTEMLAEVDLGLSYPKVASAADAQVLLLHYGEEGREYAVILNFQAESAPVSLPAGAALWQLRLNGAAEAWGGPGAVVPATLPGGTAISVPAQACLVYGRREEPLW
ncbi:MAG: malto-oligosyltrehalose trehalohydrolase [Desulfobacca sp.]|uniref:malto-oligosyltrehalose trehalohydrolase n=1 Tax=Desulfobacca sp. TaxID=2067990 RepID=UPI00404A6E50